jgi:hypothetical protein
LRRKADYSVSANIVSFLDVLLKFARLPFPVMLLHRFTGFSMRSPTKQSIDIFQSDSFGLWNEAACVSTYSTELNDQETYNHTPKNKKMLRPAKKKNV